MHDIGNAPKFMFFLVAAAILFSTGSAAAVVKPRQQGEDILLDTYRRNMAGLEKNSFGLPLFLESFEQKDRVNVDVYGIFDYPFGSVANCSRFRPTGATSYPSIQMSRRAPTENNRKPGS